MHPFYGNSPKTSFLEDIADHHLLIFCLTISFLHQHHADCKFGLDFSPLPGQTVLHVLEFVQRHVPCALNVDCIPDFWIKYPYALEFELIMCCFFYMIPSTIEIILVVSLRLGIEQYFCHFTRCNVQFIQLEHYWFLYSHLNLNFVLLFLHDPIDKWNHLVFSSDWHHAVFFVISPQFKSNCQNVLYLGTEGVEWALLVSIFAPEYEFCVIQCHRSIPVLKIWADESIVWC